jgi:hypothetical protein
MHNYNLTLKKNKKNLIKRNALYKQLYSMKKFNKKILIKKPVISNNQMKG